MAYPVWWNTDITIYNRYEDKTTNLITWHRHVIHGCFYKNANNKVTVGQTVLETNNILIRIPEQPDYISYGEWVSIPNDQMNAYFTIHQGDIIVKGEVADEIDEYVKGMRSTDLLTKYKNYGECLTVVNYQDNTGAGRVLPHYYVSGE